MIHYKTSSGVSVPQPHSCDKDADHLDQPED